MKEKSQKSNSEWMLEMLSTERLQSGFILILECMR